MPTDEDPAQPGPAARRVRITHPRTESVRAIRRRPAIAELDELTELGEVYLAALIRSQRRLAGWSCLTVATLLVGLALACGNLSWLRGCTVLDVPLPWLLLGAVVYPALIGLGWWTVRAAERNEADFVELVRRR